MHMYNFSGQWITDDEFYQLPPRNVFHKQLEKVDLPCDEHRNRHILFRKTFNLERIGNAQIYITADDYYKLYINGDFVGQGPAPAYHFRYNYNLIDVTPFLRQGENVVAVHTLYQGLINRVWQSGDNRHGLLLDLVVEDEVILTSDETFKTKVHSAYKEMHVAGLRTQFMESYDSNADEVGFEKPGFDDSKWENAKIHAYPDYTLTKQKTSMLEFKTVKPQTVITENHVMTVDFGSNYVGYLCMSVRGQKGDKVIIRCGQELDDEKKVRYVLRANCKYEEEWILSSGVSVLKQFDYKAFRYAEITLPENCVVEDLYFWVRHYPFQLKAKCRESFYKDEKLKRIWDLCVHTQKYGVQEVIQDCMEREKGFYVGDGCYTALTNMLLTDDDRMVRKLIDDAFASSFITEGLVTCLNCAHMQEIAEYPLMLIYLVLWHYRIKGDIEYLAENYPKILGVLESYRKDYEKNGLLSGLDKWCVVEWPENFRHGYDVDIREGYVCEPAHVSINAYYIEAIKTVNKIAEILEKPIYRDITPLRDAFINAFYDAEKKLFKDAENTDHISLVGNVFPFMAELCPDEECRNNIMHLVEEHKISSLSFFCTFVTFIGYYRAGREEKIKDFLLDEGAWLRMLAEDATTTFEGWGKDTKKNASLFHLTMSYAATFMADINLKEVFN